MYDVFTDLVIIKLVDIHGPRWRLISRNLGTGWSEDMVRHRFRRLTDQTQQHRVDTLGVATKVQSKRSRWTEEEDRKLIMHLEECSAMKCVSWTDIQSTFGNTRSRNALRNRAVRIGLLSEKLTDMVPCSVHCWEENNTP